MPVQYQIEESEDGGRTVWLSEHEPISRMKGMVGICLHPGKALIEAKVRLYNRTPLPQTFLWWANVGIRVHDQYQAFFPPDVTHVADHAKRAMSSFPLARNFYYGVDYTRGVDLTWYKNIPVPTSYMVTRSRYDFFGGYDHARKAGVVHVANRHIAPGKKLWTWGNAEFGYAWDRNLTDADGPYIELMAGVYTDNQPDFSWLQPYETRTFSQYWYPIQEIGAVKNANREAAVSLEVEGTRVKIGLCVTEPFAGARVVLAARGKRIFEQTSDLLPGRPFVHEIRSDAVSGDELFLQVFDQQGRGFISYRPEQHAESQAPLPASEPPGPSAIESNDRLYFTGVHLQQYRHATRSPEPYWREALRRDPLDSRCNNALGLLLLRRGQFIQAESHFRAAIGRVIERNPNPYDGEPYYNLGLALKYQGRLGEAFEAFSKATWNYAWQSAAHYALATIECVQGRFEAAIEHLDRSLSTNENHLKARDLKSAVLRRLGRTREAAKLVEETLGLDKLDFWARTEYWRLATEDAPGKERELFALMQHDQQMCLDLAFDYAEAGLWDEAVHLLDAYLGSEGAHHPLIFYTVSRFLERLQNHSRSDHYARLGALAPPDYCFPSRSEEMLVLEWVCEAHPSDAKAPYYLGNLLYDKRQYEDAIQNWERSVALDPSFSIPWRNLGIAYFNIRHDAEKSRDAYNRALATNPADARLLYELDQLEKRVGVGPRERLARLEAQRSLVDQRDDLTVELITLYNQTGQSPKALDLLASRRFNPWEGGEGLVSGQYVWAHLLLGRLQLEAGNAQPALAHFEAARHYPLNLGEGKHLLTPEVHLDYFSGLAAKQLDRDADARSFWTRAAQTEPGISWMRFYKATALARLGRETESRAILQEMKDLAERQMHTEAKIDYFATSLPNFLLFEDDLQKRNQVDCLFVTALAELGLGNTQTAEDVLRRVVSLDCNHLAAQEELRALSAAIQPRPASVRTIV